MKKRYLLIAAAATCCAGCGESNYSSWLRGHEEERQKWSSAASRLYDYPVYEPNDLSTARAHERNAEPYK